MSVKLWINTPFVLAVGTIVGLLTLVGIGEMIIKAHLESLLDTMQEQDPFDSYTDSDDASEDYSVSPAKVFTEGNMMENLSKLAQEREL